MVRQGERRVHLGPVAHELSVRELLRAPDERHVFHAGRVLAVGPGPFPRDDRPRVDPEHVHLARNGVELVTRGKVVEILGPGEAERDQRVARRTGEPALIGIGEADRARLHARILQRDRDPRVEQRLDVRFRCAPQRDQQMFHDARGYVGRSHVSPPRSLPSRSRTRSVTTACSRGALIALLPKVMSPAPHTYMPTRQS